MQVEHEKVRRWFNNAVSASGGVNPGIFDAVPKTADSGKSNKEGKPTFDREKRRLEQENKLLRELVNLSSQWISAYIAMQSEYRTGN